MNQGQHTVITKGIRQEEGILVALKGPNSGREYILIGNHAVLGRAENSDIYLHDLNVSRRHAVVKNVNGQYLLVDQKSKNGTYVNGRRIQRKPLKEGDVVIIGESAFRFRYGPPNTTVTRSTTTKHAGSMGPSSSVSSSSIKNGFHMTLLSGHGFRLPNLGNLLKTANSIKKRWSPRRGFSRSSKRRLLMYTGATILLILFFGPKLGGRPVEKPAPHQKAKPEALSTISKPSAIQKATVKNDEPQSIQTAQLTASRNTTSQDRSVARQTYSQGVRAFHAGDYRRAIALFRKVVQHDPSHPVAGKKEKQAEIKLSDLIQGYYNMGLRDYSNLYYDRAIKAWEKAMALSFEFSPEYNEKAKAKIATAKAKIRETR